MQDLLARATGGEHAKIATPSSNVLVGIPGQVVHMGATVDLRKEMSPASST